MSRSYKVYKPEDDDYLRSKYPTHTPMDEIMNTLSRDKTSIYARASKLGLRRPGIYKGALDIAVEVDKSWKIYYLRHNTTLNNREIGERLGMTKNQVMYRLQKDSLCYRPPAGEPPEWYVNGVIDF